MFATILTGLFGLASMPLVSANCTTWTNARTTSDTASFFSTGSTITLDHLVCPSSSNETCTFPRQIYPITVYRNLNISASLADVDSIFALAQENFGASEQNYPARPFITRNTNVSTLNDDDVSKTLLEVEAGKNKTLLWVPYMLYSIGDLGECSNTSLDGVGVRAAAPYCGWP